MGGARRHVLAVALAATVGLPGCLDGDRKRPLGESCTESSECEGSLVCRYGRCRAECLFDRDCPEGTVCVSAEDGSSLRVCVDETCHHGSDSCPPGLACGPDGHCHEPCDADGECGEGRICFSDVCFEDPHARSCVELLAAFPWLFEADGDYDIETSTGPRSVYCDLTFDGGGWTRIANFDAAVEEGCPGEWVPSVEEPDVCIVDSGSSVGESRSARFEPIVPFYDAVRGYVSGVQFFSTDAFEISTTRADIYVDGVSITVGEPRTHLWTYAAGLTVAHDSNRACPCSGGTAPPGFVGGDFFCDTGNDDPSPASWVSRWYTELPLWDGDNPDPECPSDSGDPSWFVKSISREPAEPIEVRLMTDQQHSDEDIGVYRMELFVR